MSPRRPDPSEYHSRYARYMDLVPEVDLCAAMLEQLDSTTAFLDGVPEDKYDYRYEPGKWTLREVVGHIVDTERLFGFRALCFARGDDAVLRRADENLYVRNAQFGRFRLGDLLEEYALVRRSNELLLRRLPEQAWDRRGRVGDVEVSVRVVGYLMVGHERHHLDVIRSRYLS